MKSQSGPGRREGCVWARQDRHPQLTAQHPPTEIQRRQGTGPGLQSISHRLLPLPRGPAGKLLQLYWDDEGSLGWWKCRRGDVKIHGGRSDLFSLEKGSQEGPFFKSPVSMGLGGKVKTWGVWDLGPSPGSATNKQYDFCLASYFTTQSSISILIS